MSTPQFLYLVFVHVAVPLPGVRPRARQGRDQSPSTEQSIGNRPPRRDATGKRWPSRSRSHEEVPLLRTFCPLVRSHRLGEAATQRAGQEHPRRSLTWTEPEAVALAGHRQHGLAGLLRSYRLGVDVCRSQGRHDAEATCCVGPPRRANGESQRGQPIVNCGLACSAPAATGHKPIDMVVWSALGTSCVALIDRH